MICAIQVRHLGERMKILKILAAIAVLSGCTPPIMEATVKPIGDFSLGFNLVAGDAMIKGPLSRDGDPAVISAAVKDAIDARLSKYDGDKRYHLITRIDAYTLGRTGVPLIFSPQTALVVYMSVWDDAAQKRLNEEPMQLIVLENTNKSNLLGSGIAQTKNQQIKSIADSAAYQIEEWLRVQNRDKGWFDPTVKLELFDIISQNKERPAEDALVAE